MTAKESSTGTSPKPRTKSEVYSVLAEGADLTPKQISSVFDAMAAMIEKDLGDQGPGVFTLPGLMKIKVVRKPATEAREGINPFTREPTIFKAKPARNVVKIQALKVLRDMVFEPTTEVATTERA